MAEAVKDSGLEEKDVSNTSTGMIMGSGGPSIAVSYTHLRAHET